MPSSKNNIAEKAREIVLSVRSTGDNAAPISAYLIINNLGDISERVAAVVEAAVERLRAVEDGSRADIDAAHDKLIRATQALLELETEDEI